ncbi:MAG TPA: 1-acyl-sn-glycerol-3-phosphate acyltransferase [Acholeplasmataceae bacterium]|nr:1-acyl-sn-glycerol-3-phosphate acyltransferase [Acholeplasmataceae bacterium]
MILIIASILVIIGSSFGYTVLLGTTWYFIILAILLGILTSGLFLVLFLIILMPVMKRLSHRSRLKKWLLTSISRFANFFLGINVKSYGKENIPKYGKLTLYANHKSQVDPFLIGSNFTRIIAFTPKISLYKIPIISNYMHYYDCLPIDRDDNRRTAQTMIKAIKKVEDGLAMLIFPEAGIKTRETGKILEVKGGAFKIGTKAESDFLPISIVGNEKIASKKWWQIIRIKVYYHPVIKYEDVKELNTIELGDLVKDVINSKLA